MVGSRLFFSNVNGLTLLVREGSKKMYEISRLIHTSEREDHDPYIEASQAQMVFYIDDETDKGWSVVVHVKLRDLYDMGEGDEDDVYENEPYQQQAFDQFFDIES